MNKVFCGYTFFDLNFLWPHTDSSIEQNNGSCPHLSYVEKGFYEEQAQKGNMANVYWYPALYHSRIMELVHEKLGQSKFMQAAKIFFPFPKELDLHETDNLVSIIQELAKTDKDAKVIIKTLIDKNPSKYWSLKDKTKKSK